MVQALAGSEPRVMSQPVADPVIRTVDLIKRFGCARDGDLMLCMHRGVAYQVDMAADRIDYGQKDGTEEKSGVFIYDRDNFGRGDFSDVRVELRPESTRAGSIAH